MTNRFFSNNRKPEDVAYDMALTLASKEDGVNSPHDLLHRIKTLYPDCLEAAKEFEESERPEPIGKIDIRFP